MTKPVAIDLFCGLGGWASGLLAEGWEVIGFDIERHVYGEHKYPAQLVVQDVLTLHGSQFKTADLIVASPPCQAYSWMAMPWSRAKAKAAAIRADETGGALEDLNRLFNACFRIQREACEAAGRHIPLIVENVRGAQPWVGQARWNYGSFYLWGDVPAVMPIISKRAVMKHGIAHRSDGSTNFDGFKSQGMNWSDQTKRDQDFTRTAGDQAIKNNGGSWFNIGSPGQKVTNQNPVHGIKLPSMGGRSPALGNGVRFTSQDCGVEGVKQRGSGAAWLDKALDERRKNPDGLKQPGIDLSEVGFNVANSLQFGEMVEGIKIERSAEDKRQHIGTKRKFASAMIAKIPEPLSRHIGLIFRQSLPCR